jgi:polar amino acid transport system substrate-binding protein
VFKRARGFVGGGLILALSASSAAFEVAVPGNQPLTAVEEGELEGLLGRPVATALQQMGVTPQLRIIPFKSGYAMVHHGKVDMMLSTLKTAERAAQAHYSAPIVNEYTLLAVRKGAAVEVEDLAALKRWRLGGRLGFSYPLLEQHGIEPVRLKGDVEGVKKLLRGHIDLMMLGSLTGPYLLQQHGWQEQVTFLPVALGKVPLGVAVSRQSWSAEQLSQFEQAIAEYQAGPQWPALLSEYQLGAWLRGWPILGDEL